MIFSWSSRAETIRPVVFETRLSLALAVSLALHLSILVFCTGSGNFGKHFPEADGNSLLPGVKIVRRTLTAHLSAVALRSPPSEALPPVDQPQTMIVNRTPETVSDHSVPSQPALSPIPVTPSQPAHKEPPAVAQDPNPTTATPSPAAQEIVRDIPQDTAEAIARRAGYLAGPQLDSKPGLLSEIHIEYPESAGSQTGHVVLQLFIDELGYVRETIVSQAIPPGFFEQAAIKAFSRARFSPGMSSGRAVKSQLKIEIDFSVFNRPTATSGKPVY